jgi:hypothetical protein
MILIGSRAFKLLAPNIFKRTPKDFDFVCTKDELDLWLQNNGSKIKQDKSYFINDNKFVIEGDSICEFELVREGASNELLHKLVHNDSSSIETTFGLVPNLDLLFTIKSSHKYLKNSPHFWKNLQDYHTMKRLGAKVRPEYQEFLKLREKETYTYLHPKLNQSKKEFFSDDNINYKYDHDDIHKSVALFDRPAYTYYMKDGQQVLSDKKKFFECSPEIRLAGVIEEAAVLAIERSLVPHPGVWNAKFAWHFALSKVCTSITSGWFREFAYENAPIILQKFPSDYFDKFQKAVSEGNVKLHTT